MPTYTYRCPKCGEFECFQSMSDGPVERCPTCRRKVQRVFHPVGIVLKGSGFHKTDYRSTKEKSSSGDEGSKDASSPEKKGSGTKPSDSKSSEGKSSGTKSSGTKSSDTKGSSSSDD